MLNIRRYIPGKRPKWVYDFIMDLADRFESKHLSLVAAGVAFYTFLSIFPALASAISIYGLFSTADTINAQFELLEGVVPRAVLELVVDRAQSLASNSSNTLTFGFVFGLLLSIWSANRAMKALTKALNISFESKETRGFLRVNVVTLALTLFSTLVFIFAITAIVLVPLVVTMLINSFAVDLLAVFSSWAVFLAVLIGFILMLYKFAPAREQPSFKRLLPGALLATILIILSSFCFTSYVANYGSYDKQYGALGAVVVTMIWMYLCGVIFIIGAEFNHRLEKDKVKEAREEMLTPL